MTTNNEIIPLRNQSIQTSVDGVTVVGGIPYLAPNGMIVEIKEPFSGFKTSLHVPAFAMYELNWLATMEGRGTTGITERGRQRAASLLRRLYDYARGERTGWPVDELTPTGWVHVDGRTDPR
jgi:hypothetical protein